MNGKQLLPLLTIAIASIALIAWTNVVAFAQQERPFVRVPLKPQQIKPQQEPPTMTYRPLQNERTDNASTTILEAEAQTYRADHGNIVRQNMTQFGPWSGNHQLFWTARRTGSRMSLTFNFPKDEKREVKLVMTKAPDYGNLMIGMAGREIARFNGYDTRVTKQTLSLGKLDLKKGANTLVIVASGKDQRSRGYFAGIDRIEIAAQKNTAVFMPPVVSDIANNGNVGSSPQTGDNLQLTLMNGARIWEQFGDVSGSNQVAFVPKNSPSHLVQINWNTEKIAMSNGVCFQVASRPFPAFKGNASDLRPANSMKLQNIQRRKGGQNFNAAQFLKWSGQTNLYVRVIPILIQGNSVTVRGTPSNVMVVSRSTGSNQSGFSPSGPPFTPFVDRPLPVTVKLEKFIIDNADEDGTLSNGDEPFLIPILIVADGSTINVLDAQASKVRIHNPAKTHKNLGLDGVGTGTWKIPPSIGQLDSSLTAINAGSLISATQASKAAQLGILVIAMEEDGTSTATANEVRKAMVAELQKQLDAEVRRAMQKIVHEVASGNSNPKIKVDVSRIQRAVLARVRKVAIDGTLKRFWNVAGIADPDDFVGIKFQQFNMFDIWQASYNRNSSLPINMEFKASGVKYRVLGNVKGEQQ